MSSNLQNIFTILTDHKPWPKSYQSQFFLEIDLILFLVVFSKAFITSTITGMILAFMF